MQNAEDPTKPTTILTAEEARQGETTGRMRSMPIPLSPAAGQKAQCHQRAEMLSRLQAPMSSTC
jgi:hypothetical protein